MAIGNGGFPILFLLPLLFIYLTVTTTYLVFYLVLQKLCWLWNTSTPVYNAQLLTSLVDSSDHVPMLDKPISCIIPYELWYVLISKFDFSTVVFCGFMTWLDEFLIYRFNNIRISCIHFYNFPSFFLWLTIPYLIFETHSFGIHTHYTSPYWLFVTNDSIGGVGHTM